MRSSSWEEMMIRWSETEYSNLSQIHSKVTDREGGEIEREETQRGRRDREGGEREGGEIEREERQRGRRDREGGEIEREER